ncbi:MAG: hypothetical protein KBD83_07630 [Gammaproteobacteria bacterium]|nr:hypothetical protein [Gammaproteobacteria bacterium]
MLKDKLKAYVEVIKESATNSPRNNSEPFDYRNIDWSTVETMLNSEDLNLNTFLQQLWEKRLLDMLCRYDKNAESALQALLAQLIQEGQANEVLTLFNANKSEIVHYCGSSEFMNFLGLLIQHGDENGVLDLLISGKWSMGNQIVRHWMRDDVFKFLAFLDHFVQQGKIDSIIKFFQKRSSEGWTIGDELIYRRNNLTVTTREGNTIYERTGEMILLAFCKLLCEALKRISALTASTTTEQETLPLNVNEFSYLKPYVREYLLNLPLTEATNREMLNACVEENTCLGKFCCAKLDTQWSLSSLFFTHLTLDEEISQKIKAFENRSIEMCNVSTNTADKKFK